MAIRPGLTRLALALAGLALGSAVHAQSLADAARAAEQQQQANAGKSVVIPQPLDNDGDEPLLTFQIVRSYGVARERIAEAMRYDGKLQTYVRTALAQVRSYDEITGVILGNPQLKGLVQAGGFTAGRYVQVEAMLLRIQQRSLPGNPRNAAIWPTETERSRQNLEFGRRYSSFVESVLHDAAQHELNLNVPSFTHYYRGLF